jgi:biopolymer transport protein TolQ
MFWWLQASLPLNSPAGGAPASEWDLLSLVWGAGPVVKGVLLILFAFSVITWAIIIAKFLQLGRAQRQTAEFLQRFWAAADLDAVLKETGHLSFSPAVILFKEALLAATGFGEGGQGLTASSPNPAPPTPSRGLGEFEGRAGESLTKNSPGLPLKFQRDAVRRVIGRVLSEQGRRLSQSLTFLATCGNTAPFIGLFGTVWGIMSSFHAIGLKGAASVATVAPGIAEALIATAAGLAAAIPAVMAYNYFLSRVRRLEGELTAFANDLLPLLASPASEGAPQSNL